MGAEVSHLKDVLAGRLQTAGLGLTAQAVRYPADSVSELIPEPGVVPWLLKVHKYLRSIDKGVAATVRQSEAVIGFCPQTDIVLAGYSQRAIVVHQAQLRLAGVPGALPHAAGT